MWKKVWFLKNSVHRKRLSHFVSTYTGLFCSTSELRVLIFTLDNCSRNDTWSNKTTCSAFNWRTSCSVFKSK